MQIKLLQGAANAYTIQPDPRFSKWFESVLIMDENEAHELSCQIEPAVQPGSASKESRFKRRITVPHLVSHRKNDSIASTVSSGSSVPGPADTTDSGSVRGDESGADKLANCSLNDSIRSRVSSASSASTPSLDSSLNPDPGRSSEAKSSPAAAQPDPYRSPDFYIIRVSLEVSTQATEGVIMYKSIMLSNREHTREVICSAMLKHGLEGSPDEFTLSQLLPDKGNHNTQSTHHKSDQLKVACWRSRGLLFLTISLLAELQIPPNANVYYAINTQHDLNFVLRPRAGSAQLDREAELFSKSTPGRKRDTSKARRKLLGLAL